MPEPTAQAPDEDEAEAQQPIGEAAGVHQVGREDEQGHREQHVAAVEAVQDLLGRGARVEPGDEQVEDGGADHREADGQSERRERHQHDDAERERRDAHHATRSSLTVSVAAGTLPCHARHATRAWRAMQTTANNT